MDPTSPAPLTEAELFQKDDLEFRAITTLLGILGTRERITLDNFHVSRQQRPSLKLLTVLSSLLVRDVETIAVILKRSVCGTTLFVCSAADNVPEKDFRDAESTSSAGSSAGSSSSETFITRNLEHEDPVGPVELLKCPIVQVDSNIFRFILKTWNQSFEHHVQSFSILLSNALANPDDDQPRQAIDIYSFVQSTPKIYRRFTSRYSPRLNKLLDLQPRFNVALAPSRADKNRIRLILSINQNGAKSHSVLYRFLRDPPVDPQKWLPEFHRFFTWFLRIMVEDVKKLKEQRVNKLAPTDLPESEIDRAYNNLLALKFFSWESGFVAAYISMAFALVIMDPADVADVGLPSECEEAVLLESPREKKSEKEPQTEQGEDDMALDFSTEFETGKTGEEQASITTRDNTHPCILELRLISSNIQNLNTIISQAPRSCYRFRVIQYALSGHSLKPWRDLIQELFPEQELRKNILQALADTSGREFNCFRPGGPDLEFKGQAHCEAVLGCLFSLTKRGEDNTWSGVPQSLLHAIGTCYGLLAPSKRCCPVCATIISFLSEEAVKVGGIGIHHSLSKHSITFPCALPVGLPSSIRHKLLDKYRHELQGRLIALLNQKRSLSARSSQSAALSHDTDAEIKLTADQKELLRGYQSGWGTMDKAARQERWGEAVQSLAVEQLAKWWGEMSEDMKIGLLPPEQVEKPVSMPEMANLTLVSEVQA